MNQPQQTEPKQATMEELRSKVADLSKSVADHQQRIAEFDKMPATDETRQLRFNALLSEMQNADQLVENHTRISLVVSMGLLAFATTEGVIAAPTWALAALGAFVIVIWCLKIYRHQQIFDYCHGQLKELQTTAIRPTPNHFWTHGFKLMYALVLVISAAWVGVVFFLQTPGSQRSSTESVETRLSSVESRLAQALNQIEVVRENAKKPNPDADSARERSDRFESRQQQIPQAVGQEPQGAANSGIAGKAE